MSLLASVSPDAADGEVLQMYRRQQQHWGYVPNYALAFSHRPELMARWAALLSGIRRNVDARRFELVTLAAALALHNSCCALAHGKALCAHLGADAVHAIACGREAEVLAPDEAAIVRFARKLARDAAAIDAADIDALREQGLQDDAIFDLVLVAAARAFFTTVLDGSGTEPDAAFGALDAPLREALTVGRPIARTPSARLAPDDRAETSSLTRG